MLMSSEIFLRNQLLEDFSDLKLALEVLDRARQGAALPFIMEWLNYFEQSAEKCIATAEAMNRIAFTPGAVDDVRAKPAVSPQLRARLRPAAKDQRNSRASTPAKLN
jgi:hypothetical protein